MNTNEYLAFLWNHCQEVGTALTLTGQMLELTNLNDEKWLSGFSLQLSNIRRLYLSARRRSPPAHLRELHKKLMEGMTHLEQMVIQLQKALQGNIDTIPGGVEELKAGSVIITGVALAIGKIYKSGGKLNG